MRANIEMQNQLDFTYASGVPTSALAMNATKKQSWKKSGKIINTKGKKQCYFFLQMYLFPTLFDFLFMVKYKYAINTSKEINEGKASKL